MFINSFLQKTFIARVCDNFPHCIWCLCYHREYYKSNVTVIYYFQVKIPQQIIVINTYDYLTKLYWSQSNYDDSWATPPAASVSSFFASAVIPSTSKIFSLDTWSPGEACLWLSNTFSPPAVTINIPPFNKPSPLKFPLMPLALA